MMSLRRRLLLVLAVAVLIVAGGYGIYWFTLERFFVSTEDAYVGGDVVTITSREAGAVLAFHADNTQYVRRGDLLVALDPVNADVAMAAAEAELARTVRAVRAEFDKVEQAGAQVDAARSALAQARSDYARRSMAGSSVSQEELALSRTAVAGADAGLRAAQSVLSQARAAVRGTRIATHPDVLAAAAKLRGIAVWRSHLSIHSPVSGLVAQRTVQLGQQIAAGTPLMAVVPLDAVWVDANFKENQLRRVQIGQAVTLTTDLYGSGVTYRGRVLGLGPGSGSAFALLPPQNASGNWIKIVQRVPVRITLDARDLRAHPLRVGLSVAARVDVRDMSRPAVEAAMRARSMESTIADDAALEADRVVARILAQNDAG